jgi:hypothetical protein
MLYVDLISLFVIFLFVTFNWLKMPTGQFFGSLGFLIVLAGAFILLMKKEPNFYEELPPPKSPVPPETKEQETTTVAHGK